MVSRTHAAARATRSKALQCCTVRKLFILCFKSRPCHGLSHTCCSEGDTIKSPAMLYSSKTFYIMFQVAPMPWSLAHMLQRGRHDQKPCNAVQFEKPLLRRRRSQKCASGHFSERKCMCFSSVSTVLRSRRWSVIIIRGGRPPSQLCCSWPRPK